MTEPSQPLICPYCKQGRVFTVRIDKTGELVLLCEECDTLWTETPLVGRGVFFADYVMPLGLKGRWSEITVLELPP
jgi:hypothetical protein